MTIGGEGGCSIISMGQVVHQYKELHWQSVMPQTALQKADSAQKADIQNLY